MKHDSIDIKGISFCFTQSNILSYCEYNFAVMYTYVVVKFTYIVTDKSKTYAWNLNGYCVLYLYWSGFTYIRICIWIKAFFFAMYNVFSFTVNSKWYAINIHCICWENSLVANFAQICGFT